MTNWQFILIAIVLTKTKDSRMINGEVPRDYLRPSDNETVEIEKRLPEDVLPRKYIIAISPDLKNDEFHGNVRIDIELLKVTHYCDCNKKNPLCFTISLLERE